MGFTRTEVYYLLFSKISHDVTSFLQEEKTESFNHMRAHRFGVSLAEGILAFARADYGRAVDLIYPVRYDFRDLCGASHAQRVSE